jgi:chloride channel protein, CIC family
VRAADGSEQASGPVAPDAPPPDDAADTGVVRLLLLAIVGGALAGLVGGLFRLALVAADAVRLLVLDWTREAPAARWLVPVVLAAVAVGIARLLVRWVPEASGSGVQRVEASIREEVPLYGRWSVIPVKFVGGVLAMGAGLALGREGPSVQMAGVIGSRVAQLARLSRRDTRTLTVSLAGAGLGVAFSAPLGGAMFVFEEVARAFRTRLVLATLAGTCSAIIVARLLVGSHPVFPVPSPAEQPTWTLAVYGILGLLLGGMGVAYNRLVVLLLDAFAAITALPAEVKAAAVGALVGLLGILSPAIVGGGETLNEAILLGGLPLATVAIVLLVRWFLGPLSYSVGAPGGLFAPLLLVGAAAGAAFAGLVNAVAPAAHLSTVAFGIVGMSTFFAAVVRAPLTGVLLIMEMTATTVVVVPMLVAAATAVLVATLLKGPPIYDTLRMRLEGP